MAEGEGLMYNAKNEQLLKWLRQKLGSKINLQPFIDFEVIGDKDFLDLKIADLTTAYKMKPVEARQTRRLIASLVKCYLVKAEVKDAKHRRGIRAAVFKMAQLNQAHYYHLDEAQSIYYSGDDLKISLLFKAEEKAVEFSDHLSFWHYDNPLIAKGLAVSADITDIFLIEEEKLKRVKLEHYSANETESLIQSLDEFEGHIASCSSASVVNVTDPLFEYQSIEKPECFDICKPYKCHIKPKTKFPKLGEQASNILAGSWTPFHQMFDGLHTEDNLPLVAVKPVSESDFEHSLLGEPPQKRYKLDLELEFRDESCASQVTPNLKNGSIMVSNTVWRSSIFVVDPKLACECLKWKWEDTQKKWRELDED